MAHRHRHQRQRHRQRHRQRQPQPQRQRRRQRQPQRHRHRRSLSSVGLVTGFCHHRMVFRFDLCGCRVVDLFSQLLVSVDVSFAVVCVVASAVRNTLEKSALALSTTNCTCSTTFGDE